MQPNSADDQWYENYTAEQKAIRTAYWRERFAAMEAQPTKEAKPLRVPQAEFIALIPPEKIKRLTDRERADAKLAKAKAKRARRREAKGEPMCERCQQPTKRNVRAKFCHDCAAVIAKEKERAARIALYANRHGIGGRSAVDQYDVEAPRLAVIARRGSSTAKEAGAAIGITGHAVRDLESGKTQPTIRTLQKLCAWLGVAPEMFARREQAA